MNELLPSIESDPELWLSVLADNELSGSQRRQLIAWLDSNPDRWRDCAISLLDQQCLGAALGESSGLGGPLEPETFNGRSYWKALHVA